MTPLDKAFIALQDDPEKTENRHHFYSLFLQTNFLVPAFNEETGEMAKNGEVEKEKALPLIMESEGNNYMMLFDHEDRVVSWSEEGVQCITLPGFVAIAMATEGLHLAMNVGTDYVKQFVPEEIEWLKQVVEQSSKSEEDQPEEQTKVDS